MFRSSSPRGNRVVTKGTQGTHLSSAYIPPPPCDQIWWRSDDRQHPSGMSIIYGGLSGSASLLQTWNGSASTGAIVYSNQTGFLSGYTYNSSNANNNNGADTYSNGLSGGMTFGYYSGSLNGFKGNTTNINFDLVIFTVTYSTNDQGVGLSVSLGPGLAFGMNKNESTTTVRKPYGDICK